MNYSHIIVIDQGTNSTRAIIYNKNGEAIFKSRQAIELINPEQFHFEQNGNSILDSCKLVLSKANEFVLKNKLSDVAVALATQRSTVIAWDVNSGNALSPALSWLDTRAQCVLEQLNLSNQKIKSITGLQISPHYGASKLRWLLEHCEAVQNARQQKSLLLGPLAGFLIYNLVENNPAYVDYSNAHRTLLWNLNTCLWDHFLLDTFSIDSDLLPVPVPNTYSYGVINEAGFPLILVNGDQNSAVYGHANVPAKSIFVNVGTGGFVLARDFQKAPAASKMLNSIMYSSENKREFAVEGTINGAGSSLSWAEDQWGVEDIENIAWHDANDVPIFLNTVGGLGSPWWNSSIAPGFLDNNKTCHDYSVKQCKAALMESIVFLIAKNIEEMQLSGIAVNMLVTSGGLTADKYFCQRLADVCAIPVMLSSYQEATSRGAAWLALGRPAWEFDASEIIYPENDAAIMLRYRMFVAEIERLLP